MSFFLCCFTAAYKILQTVSIVIGELVRIIKMKYTFFVRDIKMKNGLG